MHCAAGIRRFIRLTRYHLQDAAYWLHRGWVSAAARRALPAATTAIRKADAAALRRFEREALPPEYDGTEPIVVTVIVCAERQGAAAAVLQTILSCRKDARGTEFIVLTPSLEPAFTDRLRASIGAAKVVDAASDPNTHRLRNSAAREGRAPYLLFVTAGVCSTGDALRRALEAIKTADDVAAVGGKITKPNGRLSSAGLIVWGDASIVPYGSDEDPLEPTYAFRRAVDSLPLDFLLTRRDAFLRVGGFLDEEAVGDPVAAADYCIRLHAAGFRILYCPEVIVSSSHEPAIDCAAAARGRQWLSARHAGWLKDRSHIRSPLVARSSIELRRKRILIIDNRVPHHDMGHGLTRAHRMVGAIHEMGYCVTLYPVFDEGETWPEAYRDISPDIEIMLGLGLSGLSRFIRERLAYYDVILVSRLHNLRMVLSVLEVIPPSRRPRLLYDCESIGALREASRRRQAGIAVSEQQEEAAAGDEVAIARACDAVIAVSEREGRHFRRHGCENVVVLGHSIEALPGQPSFEHRHDFLFVGSLEAPGSPNVDGLRWFVNDILGRINAGRDKEPVLQLIVAGSAGGFTRQEQDTPHVRFLGSIPDLRPLYDGARVFVAPIRIGAGIILKVIEAAAHGVPLVTTSLVAGLLDWSDENECLVADESSAFADQCRRIYEDPNLWSRLRANALRRVRQDYAPELFSLRVKSLLESVEGDSHRMRSWSE